MTSQAAPPDVFPPGRWHGHWIAPEPLVEPGGLTLGGGAEPHPFSRVVYRRTLELDEVPATVPARLTADSRYVLVVNDHEVGRGPIRSQPWRLRYDTYDLAPYLVPGRNLVVVLVTYYGAANSFWQPASSNGAFGTDALLVLEARLGEQWLVSDEQWRVHRSPAWSQLSLGGLDGVPVEVLDARELDPDWCSPTSPDPEPGDPAWPAATVARVVHVGGMAQSQPPTNPYGALLPRGISALVSDHREPVSLSQRAGWEQPSWDSDAPARRVVQLLRDHPLVPSPPERPVWPLELDLAPDRVEHLALDFGRVTAGFVELDLIAPAGTVVELYYRERVFDPATADLSTTPSTGARYVARGRQDEFRGLECNGLRYVHLVVHGAEPGPVVLQGVRVREDRYPRGTMGSFRCSDPELDALWAAGVRTVELNAFDAYTDCPTREQRAWVGDGVVHQLVHLSTNEDWGLARNYVELGDSPRPDHMLPMTVVGEIEHSGSVTIPDWALHWVHGVHNLWRYCGADELVRSVLPTVEKVLRWYLPYRDGRGTLGDVPEWNLVDWSSVFTGARSSILTALWARGLRDYAEICEHLGNQGSARWARELVEQTRAGFEDFWDAARGCYVDQVLGRERAPAASQAAGAAAIVSGLAPRERWSTVLDRITDPERLVVRSWIGGEHGGYDEDKMADQAHGVQQADWDVAQQVVRAQPFFSYVVHDAVAVAGRAGDLVDLVRDWSEFLIDGYDTFGECWGWGTPVHGWSSTPTRDLTTRVLGVEPAEPGFASVRVQPALGGLEWAEGVVPTPSGPVRVRVDADQIEVDSPIPVLVVHADGQQSHFEPGASTTRR